MAHFLSCPYVETYTPEHIYTFAGKDICTGTAVSVSLKGQDLFNYHQGAHIQDAFPYIDAEHREWMVSGVFDSWNDLFPADEEE